ncbi:MAG: J domain-containing protein [Thaumarchaeota archaeon]|nr:J domain-containing protein [Nitrososphaerota archaeon]
MNSDYRKAYLRKREGRKKKQKSKLANFRERDDYVSEDFENIRRDPNRISDEEFDGLIEEFEVAGWSETRTGEEYKTHENYVNFLLSLEFRKRLGEIPREEVKQERIFIQTDAKSFYDVLGIKQGATQTEIKGAYHKLVKKWHPDKSKDEPIFSNRMFILIKEAYETLKDPKKRKAYDESISQ